MKILFVGHDMTYALFYKQIEIALLARTEVSSVHLYFRLSAWLYGRYILKLRAYSTSLVRLLGGFKGTVCGDSVDLRFYKTATSWSQRKKFMKLYAAYHEFIRNKFSGCEFDVAILPGEYRLFEQATISVLRSMNRPPKMIYFEAGPPGYIYLDAAGVNANASFALTGVNKLVRKINERKSVLPPFGPPVHGLIRMSLLALDSFWLLLSKTIGGPLDVEEYLIALSNRMTNRFSSSADMTGISSFESLDGCCVMFLGQVSYDVNHTHFGLSDRDIELHLVDLMTKDESLNLLWRDHPFEKSEKLFKKLQDCFPGRVLRARALSFTKALNIVQGVITVNSNGGLEALAYGLPVWLLGKSYYRSVYGVCIDGSSFSNYYKEIRCNGPDKRVTSSATKFINECFLPIDYRRGNFENVDRAAQVILQCIN